VSGNKALVKGATRAAQLHNGNTNQGWIFGDQMEIWF
jgi:hypothetical protein